jgi:hypothetical protein
MGIRDFCGWRKNSTALPFGSIALYLYDPVLSRLRSRNKHLIYRQNDMKKPLRIFAALLGLAGINAALCFTVYSETATYECAKARPTPPQPDPDHGPTLPPDPWTPI